MLTLAMFCYGHAVVPQGMNHVMMSGGEKEHGVQQTRADPKYGDDFNFDELLNIDVQEQMLVQQNVYMLPIYDA
jgi:hypothetical protein